MAFDAFMFVTGGAIPAQGETTDKTYSAKKAWEIMSFSFGSSNPSTIGSGTTGLSAGKVSVSSFNIMKKTDNASPSLWSTCCQGSFYDTATVVLRKAGGKSPTVFLQFNFKQVFVDSIQWSGSSGGDDTPTESVSFSAGSVQVQYWPQKADGTQGTVNEKAWNIQNNTNTF